MGENEKETEKSMFLGLRNEPVTLRGVAYQHNMRTDIRGKAKGNMG